MEMVYTAMLLHSLGKEINEDSVKKVLEAAGSPADDAKVKALVASLDGVNIEEAIAKAAMPVAAAAPSTEGGAKEEKKEEKKEEDTAKKAEEAAAGLGALFG